MARYNVANISQPNYISFNEKANQPKSPRYFWGQDQTKGTRVIDTAWDTSYDLMVAMLGYPIGPAYLGHDAFLSRRIPWAAPYLNRDGKAFLWATEIDQEGLGVPDDGIQNNGEDFEDHEARYTTARLTVQFATRTFDIISDQDLKSQYSGDESSLVRYVTKIVKPGAEMITLDAGSWVYCTGSIPPQFVKSRGVCQLLTRWDVQITWHQIPGTCVPCGFFNPTAANTAIDKCLGRVNSITFANYAPGTLLLVAAELKPTISPFGDRQFDITYHMRYFRPTSTTDINGNAVGHNHIFWPRSRTDATQNTWYEITNSLTVAALAPPNATNLVTQAENRSLYSFGNFRDLLRPAQYTPAAPPGV